MSNRSPTPGEAPCAECDGPSSCMQIHWCTRHERVVSSASPATRDGLLADLKMIGEFMPHEPNDTETSEWHAWDALDTAYSRLATALETFPSETPQKPADPSGDMKILLMALSNTAACLGDAMATFNKVVGEEVFKNAAPQGQASSRSQGEDVPARETVAGLPAEAASAVSAIGQNTAIEDEKPFGAALATAVLQSPEYRMLDDEARAECDELIERWKAWIKAGMK